MKNHKSAGRCDRSDHRTRTGHLVSLVTVHTVAPCLYSPFSVCDCRRSCMVVLRFRETCAVRLTLADRRCCYYCAPVCLIIMSNTFTVEKKSETKSNPQYSPTIRVQAELFEPTDNRYPVFNYQKLLIEEVSTTKWISYMLAIHAYVFHIHLYTHTHARDYGDYTH